MKNNKNLLNRVIVNPEILGGKPSIKGTRLSVEYILALLGAGMDIDEILEEHTQLIKEDILASILFARELVADITYNPLSVK